VLLGTAIIVLASLAELASAQTIVAVAPAVSVAPATQTPFPIRVEPRDALPQGCFVRVRGLPPLAALSDGHSIAPGAWAISITALPDLKVTLPAAAVGRSEVSVALLSKDGLVLAEAKSAVIVVAAAPPSDAPGNVVPGSILRADVPIQQLTMQQSAPLAAPLLTAEERERALRLVRKGHEQLAEGAIAHARLLYERAADAGLALAAMAMAATYDADEVDRLGLRGAKPDRETARRWYERARELGAPDAEQRLQRLGVN
jgi:hypothetical protein